MSSESSGLYQQRTDLAIIEAFLGHLQAPRFVDVGAEKGTFAAELLKMGFEEGVLCEPLPAHLEKLREKTFPSPVKILPFGIDSEDRVAPFHVALDDHGNELDYFHSLNCIREHEYFRHAKIIEVQCRSLESLLSSGEISSKIGLLKIDTEGNDLKVLQGLGPLRPELIMCEFVPPAVYPDWPLSFAQNLVAEAKKLGYNNFVAIQRTHGKTSELVLLDPEEFSAHDWGNLLFISDELYQQTLPKLANCMQKSESLFKFTGPIEVKFHPQYGIAFLDWFQQQAQGFSRSKALSVAFDVGAHEGRFFEPLRQKNLISKLVLFEPHPENAAKLRSCFSGPDIQVEEVAVAAATGSAEFLFGEDPATGSILPPQSFLPMFTQKRQVSTICLDDYALASGSLAKVNLLKIDTQGTDLAVLQGAEMLLRQSQPILIVEMIYAPLYHGQCDPASLTSWLQERRYQLVGFFDEHFSQDGWLAWTNACFVPMARLPGYRGPFVIRRGFD